MWSKRRMFCFTFFLLMLNKYINQKHCIHSRMHLSLCGNDKLSLQQHMIVSISFKAMLLKTTPSPTHTLFIYSYVPSLFHPEHQGRWFHVALRHLKHKLNFHFQWSCLCFATFLSNLKVKPPVIFLISHSECQQVTFPRNQTPKSFIVIGFSTIQFSQLPIFMLHSVSMHFLYYSTFRRLNKYKSRKLTDWQFTHIQFHYMRKVGNK